MLACYQARQALKQARSGLSSKVFRSAPKTMVFELGSPSAQDYELLNAF